ncbi:MAG: dipeptide epimerase, partial [Sediminibacterium sp.]|nr:dipeptide epimerase [Sediminibacterium sp.]
LFPNQNFIINALDMAYWDIYAQIQQKPLYQLFKTNWNSNPANNFTLGIDTIEKTFKKIKENPFSIYKIKLGFENDMEYLQQICNFTDAKIRIDVNGNWKVAEAIEKIKFCNNYNIECIEQPIHKNDIEYMNPLMQVSSIVLMADESCVYEADVATCKDSFNAINIKLTKCGGITPALRMINNARKLGLKIMIGNMNESIIGTAAIQHFLPLLDLVDMDGLLLLNTNFIDVIFNNDYTIKEPILHGLGIPTYINPI